MKLLFNDIQNRWMFGVENNAEKKSAIFKDNLDDPTFMTFKIEFGDWGSSILDRKITQNGTLNLGLQNNYDELPIGLLNCPELTDGDVDWTNNTIQTFNKTSEYSAYKYLRSRNEDARAKYLLYFVNGLYEIQKDYPYIFKKISGLQELEKMDPKAGQRLKSAAKITLECYEGLHLKIRTLMELYRKAAWDDVYQRWILPENMREFKMIIYIFERRVFQESITTFKDSDILLLKNSEINGNIPVKAYECYPCEIDISDSASWGGDYGNDFSNNEESSKIVFKVKNVKTYFRNGLLQDKINNIMIYDLVSNLERNKEFNLKNENADAAVYENLTVDGAKALFLNKNILLEYEDGNNKVNNKYKSYVWGHSQEGYIDDNGLDTVINERIPNKYDKSFINDDSANAQIQRLSQLKKDLTKTYTPYFPILENNYKYRGGWTFELQNAPSYDDSKSFWENLGDNVMNVLTGARQLMLISGGSFIHLIDNCLEDSYYIEPIVYNPIEKYSNGLGKLRPKKYSIIKDNSELRKKYAVDDSIDSATDNISTIPITETEANKSDINDELYERILKNDGKAEDSIYMLGFGQFIQKPKDKFEDFNGGENPRQLYTVDGKIDKAEDNVSSISKEGIEVPKEEFDLYERTIGDFTYKPLEDSQEFDKQTFEPLEPERPIKKQRFKHIEKERKIKPQRFKNLEKERDLDEQQFANLEDIRTLDEQQFGNLEKEREFKDQKFTEIEDKQHKDPKLADLELIARTIPEFKYLTLEEIRDIPEQKYLELIEATKRSIPAFETDKSALLESIKNVDGTNIKLLELDKDNKDIEDKTLETLKKNEILKNFRLEESNRDMTEAEERLKKITLFTEEFVQNSNDVKNAFVNNILEMKSSLRNVTKEIVNMLPIEDNYILKNDEDKHVNINSALMSQNDIDQINHNMKFLAINDNDVPKLSFQTLITLQNDMGRAIERSEAIKGLTAITNNSMATNPSEKFLKNAGKSVLEEPREKKNEIIY